MRTSTTWGDAEVDELAELHQGAGAVVGVEVTDRQLGRDEGEVGELRSRQGGHGAAPRLGFLQ